MPQSMQRTRWSATTHDPTQAAEQLLGLPDLRRVDVDAGAEDFTFDVRRRGTDLLSLWSSASTGDVRGEVVADTAMVLFWLKSGSGSVDDDHDVPTGRPSLFRHDPQHVRWTDYELDLIRIDRRTVEEVAAERGAWRPGPLAFQPHHVPEGPELAAFWLMVRAVAAEVLRGPTDVPASRERELTRFAAGGLLTAIPHWPIGEHGPPPTAAAARFARAEGFLLEHATEPISVEDVAEAAGLSIRGLQEAFRRHHGVTPTTYLRRIRLLLARERLESGEAESVGDVARAVGFGHLGRFANSYRAEFGELPRETWSASRRGR